MGSFILSIASHQIINGHSKFVALILIPASAPIVIHISICIHRGNYLHNPVLLANGLAFDAPSSRRHALLPVPVTRQEYRKGYS